MQKGEQSRIVHCMPGCAECKWNSEKTVLTFIHSFCYHSRNMLFVNFLMHSTCHIITVIIQEAHRQFNTYTTAHNTSCEDLLSSTRQILQLMSTSHLLPLPDFLPCLAYLYCSEWWIYSELWYWYLRQLGFLHDNTGGARNAVCALLVDSETMQSSSL